VKYRLKRNPSIAREASLAPAGNGWLVAVENGRPVFLLGDDWEPVDEEEKSKELKPGGNRAPTGITHLKAPYGIRKFKY
jgi:hypothetical protein